VASSRAPRWPSGEGPNDEIATLTGTSCTAVNRWLTRGKNALRVARDRREQYDHFLTSTAGAGQVPRRPGSARRIRRCEGFPRRLTA
jgi:hypothetical protein